MTQPGSTPTKTSPSSSDDQTTHKGSGPSFVMIAAATIGAAIINIVLFFAFGAAGATFVDSSGAPSGIANVLIMTVLPLAIGLIVATLLSRRWPALLSILRWVGIALALLTILATAAVGFDTLGFIGLALMHVVVAIAIFIALSPSKR